MTGSRGGNGDDWNVGGLGADRFVFRSGFDADGIGDFEVNIDTIRLYSLGVSSYTQLQPLMSDFASGTYIDFGGGNTLTIHGVSTAQLDAVDFWFA